MTDSIVPLQADTAISLADFPLELLLEAHKEYMPLADSLKAEWLSVKERVGSIEAEISRRMEAQRATLLAHPSADIEIEPGKVEYERDPEVLAKIQPLVKPEDFKAFYQVTIPEPEIKIDLRVRKRLEKYGDAVREILDAGIRAVPGKPRLKITHKALPGGHS